MQRKRLASTRLPAAAARIPPGQTAPKASETLPRTWQQIWGVYEVALQGRVEESLVSHLYWGEYSVRRVRSLPLVPEQKRRLRPFMRGGGGFIGGPRPSGSVDAPGLSRASAGTERADDDFLNCVKCWIMLDQKFRGWAENGHGLNNSWLHPGRVSGLDGFQGLTSGVRKTRKRDGTVPGG